MMFLECQPESSGEAGDEDNNRCGKFSVPKTEGEWYRSDKIFTKNDREACFALQLSRIPLFHLATTVGPCIILVVLMTITFIMPMDKGDRISFGVTIQLSMVVSLVFVTDVLPVKGALPFFATLIIVWMGLMGIFLFFTIAVIIIHGKDGSLPPSAKKFFLCYLSKMLLLGDLTKEQSDGETDSTNPTAIELTNAAFRDDDMAAFEGERPGNVPGKIGQLPASHAILVTTSSPGIRELISSVKAVKNEVGELIKAVKDEEESDYTLLAKVLDRLCLVLYIVSIVASIPLIMFLSK
ncbi:acetylcholine receptor subunit beta-like 2 [Branchiostoma floridae x Branchiostoma belcheri]